VNVYSRNPTGRPGWKFALMVVILIFSDFGPRGFRCDLESSLALKELHSESLYGSICLHKYLRVVTSYEPTNDPLRCNEVVYRALLK
jgi:hypothetical protein